MNYQNLSFTLMKDYFFKIIKNQVLSLKLLGYSSPYMFQMLIKIFYM